METKFTKGPWGNNHPVIYTRGANFIGQVHYDCPMAKANAHLIAAAPDLYEALELVLDELREYQLSDYWERASFHTMEEWVGDCEATSKGTKALAKARGETND